MGLINTARSMVSQYPRKVAVASAVAAIGVATLVAWTMSVVVQEPTKAFNDPVVQTIEQKANIHVPVKAGSSAADTSFTSNGMAWVYYPLDILSRLPLNDPSDTVAGPLH